MNRPDHIPPSPAAQGAHRPLPPGWPGMKSLRPLPLLCAAMLLLGALLYGPELQAWERALVMLVLVAGGGALALRAVLESGRFPDRAAPLAPAGERDALRPVAPRPPLRLITSASAPDQCPDDAMPAHAGEDVTNTTATANTAADPLTGSYNQQECRKMLALMFVRASRFHSPLTLVMVRIEQLERIGAMFGPAAADSVLVELAAFLRHQLRGSDVVARWDDAGFALLLPGTASAEAGELAARLRHLIGHTFFAGFSQLSCTIGVADSGRHASAEALVNAAARRAMPARHA